MDFDPNEITRYVESFHLNYWEGFTESDVDDFVSSIDTKRVPEFDYDAGATKLVIMPEDRDYVIKIPFSGLYNEWGDYIPFNGAEDDGYGDDYCEAEQLYYNEARKAGYGKFFMKVFCVGSSCSYPIYVQEKVDEFCRYTCIAHQKKHTSDESLKTVVSNHLDDKMQLPKIWLASCLTAFEGDEQKLTDFIKFLDDTGIKTDLHAGNLGYFKGHPVIIDYGGYHEQD